MPIPGSMTGPCGKNTRRNKPAFEMDKILRVFGFFVFFVASCALFLLVVTAGVAWQEYCERHWPQTTATIQQCSLEEVAEPPPSNLIDSRIDCQIAYVVGARTV